MSQQKEKYTAIIAEIEALESKLQEKRVAAAKLAQENWAVDVPEPFSKQFLELEKKMARYFSGIILDPDAGKITINGERYILTRSSSLSVDFFQGLLTLLDENTGESTFELVYDLLFDIAHIIGKKDAEKYAEKLELDTPIESLSAGPLHFAFTGWAKVQILEGSSPVANEDFILRYRHLESFEAEAWVREKGYSDEAVCAMSAGYSSGWCSRCYGIDLTAIEMSCAAKKGEEHCEFIMAPPSKIHQYIEEDASIHQKLPSFFERHFFKKELKKKKELIRSAEKFSRVGSWTLYFEDDSVKWSSEVYRIFEVDEKENHRLLELYYSRLDQNTRKTITDHLERIKAGDGFELKHIVHCPHHVKKWVVCSGTPLRDEHNRVIGVSGLIQDVTSHMTGDRELDHFFKMSADLLCISNTEGYFIKVSPAWTDLLGYTEEELTSQPFINFVHPEDQTSTQTEADLVYSDLKASTFENRYITKSGEVVRLSWHTRVDELTHLIYSTVRNVTTERERQERLLTSLSEKELLLREIHHRVKNNLQVISSLLSLQSGMNNVNDEVQQLYDDSQNRIKSMAAIHELFYKSETLDAINFREYIEKLVNDLIHSFKGRDFGNIDFEYRADQMFLDLDTAIPLGLIINEIVTNSLKHGLRDEISGTIFVYFKVNSDRVELVIGDDGEGLKKDPFENEEETLGIMLIDNLVGQINGEVSWLEERSGTFFKVTFPSELTKDHLSAQNR